MYRAMAECATPAAGHHASPSPPTTMRITLVDCHWWPSLQHRLLPAGRTRQRPAVSLHCLLRPPCRNQSTHPNSSVAAGTVRDSCHVPPPACDAAVPPSPQPRVGQARPDAQSLSSTSSHAIDFPFQLMSLNHIFYGYTIS
jgi:hypothetical protein